MTFKPVLAAAIMATCLSGCMTPTDPVGPAGETTVLPNSSQLRAIALDAYQHRIGKNPKDLTVHQPQLAPVFAGRNDYLVCVTTTERRPYSGYDTSGRIVKPAGSPFRQSFVMLIREYDGAWSSGIFREVEAGKIGRLQASDYCPASTL